MNPRRPPESAATHAPPAPAAAGPRTRVWLWRQHTRLERRRAELPPLPDVSTQPAALGAALRAAEQETVVAAQYLRPLFKFYPGLEAARRLMTQWCLQAGMAEIRAGRLAAAEDRFREGLAISPDRAELHGRLGLVYAQQRRLPEALDRFEAFHRLQPADPRAALFLGRVYADLGRLEDARRTLAEGVQLARRAGDAATAAQCEEALRQVPN